MLDWHSKKRKWTVDIFSGDGLLLTVYPPRRSKSYGISQHLHPSDNVVQTVSESSW